MKSLPSAARGGRRLGVLAAVALLAAGIVVLVLATARHVDLQLSRWIGTGASQIDGLHTIVDLLDPTVLNPADGLTVEVARDRVLWRQSYRRGKARGPLEKVGAAPNRRGTSVTFTPDPSIFGAGA